MDCIVVFMATVITVPKFVETPSRIFGEYILEQHSDAGFVLNWHGGKPDLGQIIWIRFIPMNLNMKLYSFLLVPSRRVKVEPDLFVAEERFTIPVPKSTDTEDEPSSKCIKQEISGLMTYQEFEKASKEGDIALLAHGEDPFRPRPKAGMIRYQNRPLWRSCGRIRYRSCLLLYRREAF